MQSPHAVAHSSFKRMLRVSGRDFFRKFYEHLLGASPEVALKFRQTDMEQQQEMLRKSFYHMLDYFGTRRPGPELTEIARRHRKAELDIPPYLYDIWAEKLLETIAEIDPDFDPQIDSAWRTVIEPMIAYMKDAYNQN